MAKQTDFSELFARLRAILQSHAEQLEVTADTAENYALNAPKLYQGKKEMFFGAVQVKKSYVSFHLMPVYVHPELLENLSDGLKKRMQGKSCFNFKTTDEVLFAELATLTGRGVEAFTDDGLIG